MVWLLVVVGVIALVPWVGLIIMVVMHGHSADRITVLEREVIVLKDTTNALTKDLGWKEK